MEKVTLSLPPELVASLNELAQKQRRSRSALVREVLQKYVERQEPTLPNWVGMIEGETAFDSTNVKSWLRGNWKSE
jgi:metal-responsive CopG/Arc/MetJ family transcriptional regulator